jgi:hypothetical protein
MRVSKYRDDIAYDILVALETNDDEKISEFGNFVKIPEVIISSPTGMGRYCSGDISTEMIDKLKDIGITPDTKIGERYFFSIVCTHDPSLPLLAHMVLDFMKDIKNRQEIINDALRLSFQESFVNICHMSVIKALFGYGGQLSQKDLAEYLSCCENNDKEIVEILNLAQKSGCFIDKRCKEILLERFLSNTHLRNTKSFCVVKYLVDNKINLHTPDAEGDTCLHMLFANVTLDQSLQEFCDIFWLLIHDGFNLNQINNHGDTPVDFFVDSPNFYTNKLTSYSSRVVQHFMVKYCDTILVMFHQCDIDTIPLIQRILKSDHPRSVSEYPVKLLMTLINNIDRDMLSLSMGKADDILVAKLDVFTPEYKPPCGNPVNLFKTPYHYLVERITTYLSCVPYVEERKTTIAELIQSVNEKTHIIGTLAHATTVGKQITQDAFEKDIAGYEPLNKKVK